jgi:7,8-dihydropterin-6-yl-methyl-4-(beta-D-ribofuranosyl)aminobenzene 5'-phosphate synthase
MRTIGVSAFVRLSAVSLLLLLTMSCANQAHKSPDPIADKAEITILYDAFGKPSDMQKDWGFSAFIEYQGKRILFDTGDNPDILEHNAKAAGVDLSRLDFVVLSHRHGDHIGGMDYLLRVNPNVKIYAPKENFGVFGSSLPGSFYRRDDALPPEQRYFDGKAPETLHFGSAWPNAHIELIDKTTQIMPGMTLIALVSDKPTTLELKELSLAIDTPDGLVVVVGCAHPGIDKILNASAAIDKHIHLVVGGMHMVVAKDPEIEKAVTALHDTAKVDYVAPGHCTGEATFAALREVFGDHYRYAGLGTRLTLGPDIHASINGTHADSFAFDATDQMSYARLLAIDDDDVQASDNVLISSAAHY